MQVVKDWELGIFVELHGYDLWGICKRSGEDKLCWRLDKKKRFIVSA